MKIRGLKFLVITFFAITTLFANQAQVQGFVERFYQTVLDRHSDTDGLNYWTNSLLNGERAGADIARGFIFSQEFTNRDTSDQDYLYILYRAFFNREPDNDGYFYWLDNIRNGVSREEVLYGFLYSTEFYNLCQEYGISPIDAVPIDNNDNKPPVANAGNDQTINLGDTIYFDASGSYDTDGVIVSYKWSNGSNSYTTSNVYDSFVPTGLVVGNNIFTLTVTDDQGATATDTVNIIVKDSSNGDDELPDIKKK